MADLIDRLSLLVSHPDLRRTVGHAGHAGQARARQFFDWAHVFRQHRGKPVLDVPEQVSPLSPV
jgi:hypothetical protein